MYFTVVTDPASNSSNTLSTAVNWPDSYESDDMLSSQYVQVSPQFHSQSSKVNTRIHTYIPVPSHIQPSFPLLAHISSYGHPIYPFIYTHTSSYVAPPPVVAALHFPYMHVLQNTTHATTAQNVPNSPHISAPQANIACISPVVQAYTSRFPDYGASNHLTNVAPNPHVTTQYTGAGNVLVGNGSSLHMLLLPQLCLQLDNFNYRICFIHLILLRIYFPSLSFPGTTRCILSFTLLTA